MQRLLFLEAAKHSCRLSISAADELPLQVGKTNNVYILSGQIGKSEFLPFLAAFLLNDAVVLQIG